MFNSRSLFASRADSNGHQFARPAVAKRLAERQATVCFYGPGFVTCLRTKPSHALGIATVFAALTAGIGYALAKS